MTSGKTARQTELGAFLRAMRARLAPQDVGLPAGERRRLAGLRRQEVAQLAVVSVDWYIRLEQGRVGTPGFAVLEALADALRLSEPQRRHLHLVARGESPAPRHRPAPVSASLRAILAGMPMLPAYVMDFRFDVLARNEAAAALFGSGFDTGTNVARMMFLDHETKRTQPDWERFARETVGNLRANLARHRGDARLEELVAELRARSPEFDGWWQDHTVDVRATGRKRLRHSASGEFTVCYDALATLDDSDQRLFVLTPADATAERALRTIIGQHSRRLAVPAVA
jgi:transcriptional regulator with XRE-family HTH domain